MVFYTQNVFFLQEMEQPGNKKADVREQHRLVQLVQLQAQEIQVPFLIICLFYGEKSLFLEVSISSSA